MQIDDGLFRALLAIWTATLGLLFRNWRNTARLRRAAYNGDTPKLLAAIEEMRLERESLAKHHGEVAAGMRVVSDVMNGVRGELVELRTLGEDQRRRMLTLELAHREAERNVDQLADNMRRLSYRLHGPGGPQNPQPAE